MTLLLALIAISGPQAAQATATTPAADERKICRVQPAQTGGRLKRERLCLTAAQWDERSRDTSENPFNRMDQPSLRSGGSTIR